MVLNVLLMLSSDQPPPPREEVRWHADQCARHQQTHLITTRILTGLTVGKSTVAFYGNVALGNQYLGRGVYLGYIPIDSPAGQRLLNASPLYSRQGMPATAKAFIQLRGVRVAQPGESLNSLDGIMRSTGRPLKLANIPRGPSRAQVYYRSA